MFLTDDDDKWALTVMDAASRDHALRPSWNKEPWEPHRLAKIERLPDEVMELIAGWVVVADPDFEDAGSSALRLQSLLETSPKIREQVLGAKQALSVVRLGHADTLEETSVWMARTAPRRVELGGWRSAPDDEVESWMRLAYALVKLRDADEERKLDTLRELRVWFSRGGRLEHVWSILSIQSSSDKLETLNFHGRMMDQTFKPPPFLLAGLKHLALQELDIGNEDGGEIVLLPLLEMMPNLVTLLVTGCPYWVFASSSSAVGNPVVELACLKDVNIELYDRTRWATPMPVSLPALETLVIWGWPESTFGSWSAMMANTAGTISLDGLKTLELTSRGADLDGVEVDHGVRVDDGGPMAGLLPEMLHLERLTLNGMHDPDGRVLKALTLPRLGEPGPVVLPELNWLDLRWPTEPHSVDRFEEMVRSRVRDERPVDQKMTAPFDGLDASTVKLFGSFGVKLDYEGWRPVVSETEEEDEEEQYEEVEEGEAVEEDEEGDEDMSEEEEGVTDGEDG